MTRPAGFLAVAALTPLLAAQSWKVQYFYDEERSSLEIADLQFSSPLHGVAVGSITQGGRRKPAAVVTGDGGAHWSLVPLREPPRSVFLLNESVGWLVTGRGLWRTANGGRQWSKLTGKPSEILRVHFLDAERGFAAGARKGAWETRDGGTHWTPIGAAAKAPGSASSTEFSWISFMNPERGVILGGRRTARSAVLERPAWLDPKAAAGRSESTREVVQLNTSDGGKTWTPSYTSSFGRLTRLRAGPLGLGLGIIEYTSSFAWAAYVLRVNWMTGVNDWAFRSKDCAISDAAVTSNGTGYLAGVAASGKVRSGLPTKVRILTSRDLTSWTDMAVDYRAVAERVMLSSSGDSVWAATDTGMILKLVP